MQTEVRAVKVDRRVARYIIDLVDATRRHASVRLGSSPRGALILFRTAQAHAFLDSRAYAIPEDVKAVAIPTLAHRLTLDTKAKYAGLAKEDVVREILAQTPVGV